MKQIKINGKELSHEQGIAIRVAFNNFALFIEDGNCVDEEGNSISFPSKNQIELSRSYYDRVIERSMKEIRIDFWDWILGYHSRNPLSGGASCSGKGRCDKERPDT